MRVLALIIKRRSEIHYAEPDLTFSDPSAIGTRLLKFMDADVSTRKSMMADTSFAADKFFTVRVKGHECGIAIVGLDPALNGDRGLQRCMNALFKVLDSKRLKIEAIEPADLRPSVDYCLSQFEAFAKMGGISRRLESDIMEKMRQNIEAVIERGEKLEDLERETALLEDHSLQFRNEATDYRKTESKRILPGMPVCCTNPAIRHPAGAAIGLTAGAVAGFGVGELLANLIHYKMIVDVLDPALVPLTSALISFAFVWLWSSKDSGISSKLVLGVLSILAGIAGDIAIEMGTDLPSYGQNAVVAIGTSALVTAGFYADKAARTALRAFARGMPSGGNDSDDYDALESGFSRHRLDSAPISINNYGTDTGPEDKKREYTAPAGSLPF